MKKPPASATPSAMKAMKKPASPDPDKTDKEENTPGTGSGAASPEPEEETAAMMTQEEAASHEGHCNCGLCDVDSRTKKWAAGKKVRKQPEDPGGAGKVVVVPLGIFCEECVILCTENEKKQPYEVYMEKHDKKKGKGFGKAWRLKKKRRFGQTRRDFNSQQATQNVSSGVRVYLDAPFKTADQIGKETGVRLAKLHKAGHIQSSGKFTKNKTLKGLAIGPEDGDDSTKNADPEFRIQFWGQSEQHCSEMVTSFQTCSMANEGLSALTRLFKGKKAKPFLNKMSQVMKTANRLKRSQQQIDDDEETEGKAKEEADRLNEATLAAAAMREKELAAKIQAEENARKEGEKAGEFISDDSDEDFGVGFAPGISGKAGKFGSTGEGLLADGNKRSSSSCSSLGPAKTEQVERQQPWGKTSPHSLLFFCALRSVLCMCAEIAFGSFRGRALLRRMVSQSSPFI